MDCQDPQVHYCFALVMKDAMSLVMFAVVSSRIVGICSCLFFAGPRRPSELMLSITSMTKFFAKLQVSMPCGVHRLQAHPAAALHVSIRR